jgi:hypothetical protein
VRYLQRFGPSRQERSPSKPVTAGMRSGKGIVEGETPIRQNREEGKGLLRSVGPAVGTIPAKDEKERGEGVEGQ